MVLKENYKSTIATLDYDSITLDELRRRVQFIKDNWPWLTIETKQSACRGFHVIVQFCKPIQIVRFRNELKDDGTRLVMDLLNRDNVHDRLWQQKRRAGTIWKSHRISIEKKWEKSQDLLGPIGAIGAKELATGQNQDGPNAQSNCRDDKRRQANSKVIVQVNHD